MPSIKTRAAGVAVAALMASGIVTVSAGTAAAAGGYPTQEQLDKYVTRGGPYVVDCNWNHMILMDWGHNPFPRRSQLRISLDRCSRELNEVNGWHAQALERVGRLRGVLEAARRQHGRSSTEAKKAEKELAAAIRAAQELEKDIEDLQQEIGRIEDRLGDL
ncbi:hypothetical protein ACFWP2_34780 [Kitasatospora sp. NPDC058444]|uniref:hypothetical protein n=1 Tax=Kitasatospora sp. NPDC058444 TaxID=3346504 RepID=UPI0036691594